MVKLSAQDVIITQQSERIDAKVIRVTETEIEYKRNSNPDGPTFVMPLKKVSAILYANGEVQSFQIQKQEKQLYEQEQTKQTFNGGYSFMIGYAMAMIKDEIGSSSLTTDMHGMYFGVGLSHPANEYFVFRPSIILSAVFKESSNMFDIKVPVLVSIGTNMNENYGIHVLVGPQFCLGLSAGSEFDLAEYPDIMKRFDIGVTVGFGVRFSNTTLDLGYTFGLINRNEKTSQSGVESHINWLTAGISTSF